MVKDNLSPLSGGRIKCLLILVIAAIATSGGAGQAWAQPAATTTTLAVASGGSAVTTLTSGSVVTLTATVLVGTTPVTVGQVNFCNAAATHCTDINVLATAQITSAGTAVFKFRPGVGSHSYNAVFVGTPNGVTAYSGSTSSAASLTVTGLWPSFTTIAASPSGNAYDLTATVSGNASTAPTGSVSFLNSSNGNAVLGTATLGAGTAGLSFFNSSNPAAGTSPISVVVGDFNGDGIPDIAAANYDNTTVTILLGNGDGTFTATPTSPEVGIYPFHPYAIAAGDFNGDGKMDLAVTTNGTTGNVTILLGNGDGTFTPVAANPAVGSQPSSIVVGDFNGDGILDLAVVAQCGYDLNCVDPGTATILLGDGTGNFTPTASSPIVLGGNAWGIAVGDFNGDGNLDLAVTQALFVAHGDLDNTLTILMGGGDGTFSASTIPGGNAPSGIVAGDFNGDGISDLAVTDQLSDSVLVLLGNANGTFTVAANPQTGEAPLSVAVGDFNDDGIPDLAVANENGCVVGSVTILLGRGDGTFTPTASSPATGNCSFSIASGDFVGDGVRDLAVANNGNDTSVDTPGSVSVLLGETQSSVASLTTVAVQPVSGVLPVLASYAGDSNYAASISGEAVLNTGPAAPTVSVLASSYNISNAQALTVTISVHGGTGSPTPTGSVTLTGGGYTSPATTLFSGAAQVNIPAGSLAAGNDTLTANYAPDASSSAVYTSASGTCARAVVVSSNSLVVPTVEISPDNSSISTTQALGVYVFVVGGTFDPTPTGSVTLTGGGYTSAATTLNSGGAQINIPAGSLAIGSDTLTVNYTPDASSSTVYNSAGGAGAVLVTSNTLVKPTVAVVPASQSITTAQTLQVNVTVSGPSGDPTPTGSVMLTGGFYASAATTLNSGAAQINIPAGSLAIGSDTLTVNYTPDASSSTVYTSASGTSTVAVTLVTPTVTVTPASPNTTPFQSLTVTVSLSGAAGSPVPTGTVTLASGSYASSAATLSSGTASITIPAGALSLGTDTLTASYTPDSASSNLYTGATGSSSVAVNTMTPTVNLSPALKSLLISQALSVVVAVSGPSGGPSPTGSVMLTSGSYTSVATTLSSGSATINIPAYSLSTGSDTLTASYTPDSSSSSNYNSASGTSSAVTVAKTTPTVTVTPSSSSITAAQGLTVTVVVSGGTGSPTATGSVTLTGGGYNSGAVTLNSGSAAINIPADSLSTGSVTLTASYSPDSSSPDYTGASGKSTVTVSSFTPTVTVTPLSTSILTTQALQVNVSVSGPSGDPTPTGTTELTGGGYDSGAITLSGGSVAISIPAGSLSLGNDTLSVSYTPDSASIATYSSATGSSSVAVTAPNPSPVVGSISPAVQSAGSAAFTLTVNGSGFISGSTVYWGASALTTQFGSAAQITAQVPASDIESSATEPISVENPSPGGGTSNTLQFEVDSSGAGSPSFAVLTATVTPGQSATYSVTLPSAATAVTASCLNLPSGASCSFSSTAGTVTITTSSTTPAGTYQVTMVFTATVPGEASSFVLLPILLLPLLLVRRKWTAANIGFTACLGLVLMAAAAGVGCGSGAAGAPPVAPTHEVTTAGAVTLTVQ